MQGKYFQELRVGEVFQSPRRTVTETDVVLFTSLAGLHNPLFTDEVFAQEKGFGSRVAPGPLTMAIAMGLTDELLYGTTTAALGVNNAVFKAPVRPGDTVSVKTTVVEKRESRSQPDRGPVTLRHQVYNQQGQEVISFERTLMVLKKA